MWKTIGATTFLMFVVAVAVFGGYFYLENTQNVELDANTFCEKDQNLNVTIVFVDKTDRFDRVEQQSKIVSRLKRISEDLEEGDYLAVYLLRSADEKARVFADEIFSACRPARQALNRNQTLLERDYQRKFEGPLREIAELVAQQDEGAKSPIIEELERVILSENKFLQANEKSIVIISDFIQNSQYYSMYKGKPDWERLKEGLIKESIDLLKGAKVSLLVVERDGFWSRQKREILPAWISFFESVESRPRWQRL